ncbi:hypothetical protein B5F19_09550 [Pseudoflavonifractor sp. An184]|nr:hypothetical protein B5F19_09550 [Pseudoflavonifractor sp. An184]
MLHKSIAHPHFGSRFLQYRRKTGGRQENFLPMRAGCDTIFCTQAAAQCAEQRTEEADAMKGLLWQPGRLGPVELRNRTIRSATNEHLSQPDGQLTQVWAETLAELARNEVGLVITGHLCVDRTQRADEGQPVLDGQTDRALLAQAAEKVHRAGGRIAAQLSHSGKKAMEAVNGRPAKAPEDFSPEELDRLAEQFRLGVQLCREAGFDAVQIHTSHGYLLSNFLNPEENLRTDQYGGRLENRFRLVGRILQAAREACGPEMALLVKADCNGCGDLHRLLELYQEAGADGVELSGVDFAARAGEKSPFYLQEALRAMDGIQIPLSLVGGIFDLETAEAVLEQGFTFVSFSRALICQPDFIARMKRGEQTKSACLACNGCYQIYRRRPVRCVQHKDSIPQLEKVFGCSM